MTAFLQKSFAWPACLAWHLRVIRIADPSPLAGIVWRVAILTAVCLLLAGCAGNIRKAVPETLASDAQVVGLEPGVRYWGDESDQDFDAALKEKYMQMRTTRPELFKPGLQHTLNLLAISGGGPDGAFGAGLLVGWSAAGDRPEFEVVTGVSTGALMAPFVFLGPKYDRQLKEMYTRYSTRDLLEAQVLAGLFGGPSIASSEPLYNIISSYVDEDFLKQVAREHNRGRRLMIGTTNLDAQRPVIWNMGKIATISGPRALKLFRKILLASASIPGVFPPVYIEVEVGGKIRKEMHVDGGTTDNAFFLPMQVRLSKHLDAKQANFKRRLFVIVNNKTNPEYEQVKPNTISIATRSISTLIKQQTVADVFKLYEFSRRNGIDFNLAYVPQTFKAKSEEPFDAKYMTALFETGYALGAKGYSWQKTMHGF